MTIDTKGLSVFLSTVNANDYDSGYAAGVAAERERCMKLCDKLIELYDWDVLAEQAAEAIRDAIEKQE